MCELAIIDLERDVIILLIDPLLTGVSILPTSTVARWNRTYMRVNFVIYI